VLKPLLGFESPGFAVRRDGARFDPACGMQGLHEQNGLSPGAPHGIAQTIITTRRLPLRGRFRPTCPRKTARIPYPVSETSTALPQLSWFSDLGNVRTSSMFRRGDLAARAIRILAAYVDHLPLIVTIHCSFRHMLVATSVRS
jgi:hypothetical protein